MREYTMTERSPSRRELIGGFGAGLAAAAAGAGRPQDFVLVHGSSAGGWCFPGHAALG